MRYRGYQGFRLTPVLTLIIINIIVFVGYLVNSNLLLARLGLRGTGLLDYLRGTLLLWYPQTIIEQPWTIITSLFVHGGFAHIIFNMLTLYWFGTALSQLVGDRKFLLVYFCGGLLGNIFFLLLAPPFPPAVGASGAIFALGGTLAIMRPQLRVIVFPIPVPLPLWIAVIGSFIILFILSFVSGIAWQAHLGGIIFGLVAGYFFRRQESRYRWR